MEAFFYINLCIGAILDDLGARFKVKPGDGQTDRQNCYIASVC